MRRILILMLASCFASAAAAAGRWEAFVRPSGIAAIEADTSSIWAATTDAGLLRFDRAATTFEFFNRQPSQLISNELSALAFDRTGRLWVGTAGSGVSVRSADGASWRAVSRLDQLPSDSVTALAPDGDNMWIGTRAGLAFWNGNGDGSIDAYWPNEDEAPFASNIVRDVVVSDTTVWVATTAGVYRNSAVKAGPWSAVNGGLASLDVVSIAAFQGTLFAVAAGGVYVGGETGTWSSTAIPSTAYHVRGQRGKLLASTAGGVFRWTGSGWLLLPHVRPPGADPGPAAGVLAVDRDTLTWAGTGGGLWRNVSYTDPDSLYWRFYAPNAPVGNSIVGLLLDGDRIWVTVDGNGVSRFDGTRWTNWAPSTGCISCPDQFYFPNQGVAALLDAQGYKWIAFWTSALERFDDRAAAPLWEHKWAPPPPLSTDPDSVRHTWGWAACLDSTPNRRVWFGGDSPLLGSPGADPIGLDVYDNGALVNNYQTNNSALRGNQIRALGTDHFGNMYVGYASKGADGFSGQSGPILVTPIIQETDPFPDVHGIVANGSDLWIVTSGTLERWTVDLPHKRVFQAFLPAGIETRLAIHPLDVDASGDAWVGTEGGLYWMKRDRSDSTLYTKTNSPLVGNQVRNVAVDRARGVIWIGANVGLNRFEPNYTPPPEPALPSLSISVYPNPGRLTNSGTIVRLRGDASAYTGAVYDLRGALVRHVGVAQGGIVWDGRDDQGHLVGPGIYFVRVEAGGRHATARVVLLR